MSVSWARLELCAMDRYKLGQLIPPTMMRRLAAILCCLLFTLCVCGVRLYSRLEPILGAIFGFDENGRPCELLSFTGMLFVLDVYIVTLYIWVNLLYLG